MRSFHGTKNNPPSKNQSQVKYQSVGCGMWNGDGRQPARTTGCGGSGHGGIIRWHGLPGFRGRRGGGEDTRQARLRDVPTRWRCWRSKQLYELNEQTCRPVLYEAVSVREAFFRASKLSLVRARIVTRAIENGFGETTKPGMSHPINKQEKNNPGEQGVCAQKRAETLQIYGEANTIEAVNCPSSPSLLNCCETRHAVKTWRARHPKCIFHAEGASGGTTGSFIKESKVVLYGLLRLSMVKPESADTSE
jgi:hypothetical protein